MRNPIQAIQCATRLPCALHWVNSIQCALGFPVQHCDLFRAGTGTEFPSGHDFTFHLSFESITRAWQGGRFEEAGPSLDFRNPWWPSSSGGLDIVLWSDSGRTTSIVSRVQGPVRQAATASGVGRPCAWSASHSRASHSPRPPPSGRLALRITHERSRMDEVEAAAEELEQARDMLVEGGREWQELKESAFFGDAC
jgi:hypothetical protein